MSDDMLTFMLPVRRASSLLKYSSIYDTGTCLSGMCISQGTSDDIMLALSACLDREVFVLADRLDVSYSTERYINNLMGGFSICFSEHLTGHPTYLLILK